MKPTLVLISLAAAVLAAVLIVKSRPGAPTVADATAPASVAVASTEAPAPVAGGTDAVGSTPDRAATDSAPASASPSTPAVDAAVQAPAVAAAPPRRRAWTAEEFARLGAAANGASVRFELLDGEFATATVRHHEHRDGELIFITGIVATPEAGRFFFQRQTGPGKAGAFAGLVEFPASKRAYRLEPTGAGGASELVERRLDEVVCLGLPPAPTDPGAPEEIPPLEPDDFPTVPIPDYQNGIIVLESVPGATPVLYLDFQGGYTPTWGGITYERPNVSNAQIREVWKRVAEDYMGFNINVTTDLEVYQSAPETSRQRVVLTPTTTAAPGAGGVAYMNSWNWSGDTPCWSFYTSGKAAAEVVSHEAGHTLGLAHDGRTVPEEGYFGGHGSGETGWAPIMGVGYYQGVTQWSKGEYANANQTQDDLALITTQNNSVAYRADDTGATLATARFLEIFPGNVVNTEGVIERTADTDAFKFTTTGGAVTLRANPVAVGANLALSLALYNAADTLIASANPQGTLWASLTTALPAGAYTFRVTGAGRNDPLTSGFTSYASLGYYSITGTVAGAVLPTRFALAENSANGALVGTVPANNPGGDPLVYAIVAGNPGGTFAINNNGALTVANNALLDYETLARNLRFAPTFDLTVSISNTVNPAPTETNRRVVVTITDVNEAPGATGFTRSVFERTQPGTVLGTVTGTDPDFYTLLGYSIVAGDPGRLFAIGTNSGQVSIAGALIASNASVHTLTVRVTDNGAPALNAFTTVTVNVLTNQTPFLPGSISYAVYDNIGAANVISGLTGNARFPRDPDWEKQMTSFEADSNRADAYGAVMRGFVIPPVSGTYRFYIATDDNGELWYSPTTNTATIARVAYIDGDGNWASPRQWNKYSSQRSTTLGLTAGQACYLEARMKEGSGGDNLAVAWSGPATDGLTNVISGLHLAPFFLSYQPKATGFTNAVHRDALAGARVGRVHATDPNPGDTLGFVILAGNSDGLFTIGADGWLRVANESLLQSTGATNRTLTVRVADNGVPMQSRNVTCQVGIVAADTIVATSLRREMFHEISGTAVSALTGSPKYPGRPDALMAMTDFASPVDVAENYGSRIRAYLTPSVGGIYRFFIASDDNSQLWFSPIGNPASIAQIAAVTSYTSANAWGTYASQTSPQFNLVAGQRYYLEARQKEGGGGDHVSVGWAGPGVTGTNVIAAAVLSPADLGVAPVFFGGVFTVPNTATNGQPVGALTATDSPLEQLTFKIVAGDPHGTFAVAPDTGLLTVADNTALAGGLQAQWSLTVAVQDSGYGDLYPRRSKQATVQITADDTRPPFVWTGQGESAFWSEAANWGGTPPAAQARLVFGLNARKTNTNDAPATVRSVTFTNAGFVIHGEPVTLQSSLANQGSNAWHAPLLLSQPVSITNAGPAEFGLLGPITNDAALALGAGGDIRLSGPVTGPGGLTKSGPARLLFSGTHTYSGNTVIAAGDLTNAVEINGATDLVLPNSDVFLEGRMDLWNHSATLGALNGTGTVYCNNATRSLTVGASGRDGVFQGIVQDRTWQSGARLVLRKTGGGAQTLAGANTYSAGTFLSGGTLIGAHPQAFGTGFITLGDANTGAEALALLLAANVDITNTLILTTAGTGPVTIGSTGVGMAGDATTFGGTLSLSRPVKLVSTVADRTHFAGRITGSPGTVTVTGGGRTTFGFNGNAFVGAIVLTGAGTILQTFLDSGTFGNNIPDTSAVEVGPGTALQVYTDEVIGPLTGAGTVRPFARSARLYVGGGNGSGVFEGLLTDDGGFALALTKLGSGTQSFTGTGAFSGGVNVSAGTLQIGDGGPDGALPTPITNYASLVFNRAGTLVHAAPIRGSGTVAKTGPGIVRLATSNSYSGATTISEGTLALADPGAVAASPVLDLLSGARLDVSATPGGFVLASTQTLQGEGLVLGDFRAEGVVSPGASVGTLSFSNDLVLTGTTVLEVQRLGGLLTNDRLIVAGTLTRGGLLVVTNIGEPLQAGDGFDLIDAGAIAWTFSEVLLPPLRTGLKWSLMFFGVNGRIGVQGPPTPQFETPVLSGDELLLRFLSGTDMIYIVESATNAVPPVAWDFVTAVSGDGGMMEIAVPVDTAEPQRFYRLRMEYPD